MAISDDIVFQQGMAALQAGNPKEAERSFRKVLRHQPRHFAALNLLAIALMQTGRFADAEPFLKTALTMDATNDATLSNYGYILKMLSRPAEALDRFSQALAINPANSLTWNNRGTVLYDLARYEEAIASFDKATSLDRTCVDAFCSKGNSLCQLNRYDEALAVYKMALSAEPRLADAWLGLGNVFYFFKRYDEAFDAYGKALAHNPDLAEAWLGRGNAFFDLYRHDEALAAYDAALARKSDLADAWLGRGNIFQNTKRYQEAFASYAKALALKPDATGVEGGRLTAKLNLCDWTDYEADVAHVIAAVRQGKLNILPFSLLAIPSSSDDQLQCARLTVERKFPPRGPSHWQGACYDHARIRVAYLSADFSLHATAYLMAGLFEAHDKSRFELTAISLGPDDSSDMRRRLEASFDRFIDARVYSDDALARLIAELEIDILVDLKGYTEGARTSLLARRPAPIQVNYLGYPGTMGAGYIDYIIADPMVIPETSKPFYSEKVVHLPNSYQVNDDKRLIADRDFTRAELGLPPAGFVFCCFNNNYKIAPPVFDIWMRILGAVEGSVLWLFEDNAIAAGNLRQEAVARGVDAGRLVFAQRLPLAEHLARHRQAGLFLDTLPYNAHTTASDALWAGLPVLTRIGDTFAGRVAASLLTAVDLPELVVPTPQAYESMAIDLGNHPEKLAGIKSRLARNRLAMPLFDTRRFTADIEAAYAAMVERQRAGLPPDHLAIANR